MSLSFAHFELLAILALGLLLALLLGFLTNKLKLSPIVGYLVAGFIIGPHTPGFVADAELASQLAEVGVILLMFGVGLHFDLRSLLAVRGIAIPGAIAQSLAATGLGLAVALAFGMSLGAGLVLGLGLSVASTVVLMHMLSDNNLLDSAQGHVAVGWLVVEDIFTVFVLVLMPTVANMSRGSAEGADVAAALGLSVLRLALLWILVIPVGGRVIPWLLSKVARVRSRELFTLSVLVVAFVIAGGSAFVFGASVALGAFLAGMVVGASRVSHQAAAEVLPLRDAFAVLFFLSVGMLFDPRFLIERPGLVLACLAIVLLAKPLVAGAVVLGLGHTVRTGLTVAIGLAQIGEFSFILAQQAQQLSIISSEVYSVLVACALFSIALNPLLFRGLAPLEAYLQRKTGVWEFLCRTTDRRARTAKLVGVRDHGGAESGGRAIVVGYGPTGQRLADLLEEQGLVPVVVDLNLDTVSQLQAQGQQAVYGDASRRIILSRAGAEKADYLLVTIPDVSAGLAIATEAERLNSGIRVFLRARYLKDKESIEHIGAECVSCEEEEVARAMSEALTESLR